MASWLTLYLAANPEWKERVLTQTRSFVAKYAPLNGSLSSRLAHLPPKVWEEEMSVLDVCLKETIRINTTGACLRRVVPTHTGEDVIFQGKKLSVGTFVACPITDPHLNPNIYTDPET